MLAGFFAMLPDDYENLSQSVIATNFFGNNILSAITTGNYWDVVNDFKPLMHTWYVGVVMQFYLFYPILFLLAKMDKKCPEKTLLILITSLACISLLIYFVTTNDANRFYYLPSRFFEFAAGGLVALRDNRPRENNSSFYKILVFVCYALLLGLLFINVDLFPSIVRLVVVVVLSCVLFSSNGVLENQVTGNVIIAKIGAASYSIFIWHQILLAFYRYTVTNSFELSSYILLLLGTVLISWLSYRYVEQTTNNILKAKKGRVLLYSVTTLVFVALNVFAGLIYMRAGVVRDVPELYISKNDIHRGMHAAYNEKINQYDQPFTTTKPHWLVVGNSFGRDFSNVILESPIADRIELSYIREENCTQPMYGERYATADIIFLSSLGTNEETVKAFEDVLNANGFNIEKLVIVGTKNFGESNGQFYVNRNKPDYFSQRTQMEQGYYERNEKMKARFGNRYLDLIGLVIDDKQSMPVFTPDHHYVSQDCRHFSKGGAIWFAQLIDWEKYFE